MRDLKRWRSLIGMLGVVALSACLTGAPVGFEVRYVQQAPPRRNYETVGVAPSREYVWIPGYFAWQGSSYLWISGRYDLPPRGYRSYEPGQWRHTSRGWYWVEGRWR